MSVTGCIGSILFTHKFVWYLYINFGNLNGFTDRHNTLAIHNQILSTTFWLVSEAG
ncbi:hypothetical protein KR49_05755 [Synechococcus sp. KORDI-49]|nr:hypothetical protein KR49_05755 [Synechococcus sp. KORDI-49]